MKKSKLLVLLFIVMMFPLLTVNADTEMVVRNQAELKEAIENREITTITLGGDIETTEKINITRPLTINGNSHMIKYVGTFGRDNSTDYRTWGGIYVLQVYKTTATIKNIKLTGGNAALLVNGSKVTFEGMIDVSGNGFGGIELGQGQGVTETVKITLGKDADLINTTESEGAPTLWVPADSDAAIVEQNGEVKAILPEQELNLNEIEALFEVIPQTLDNIVVYGTTLILALGSLITLLVMMVKNKEKEFN